MNTCLAIIFLIAVLLDDTSGTPGNETHKRIKRLLRADDIRAGDFPFYVTIMGKFPGHPDFNLCGGALLSSQVVITAAHCVFDRGIGKKAEHVHVIMNDYYPQEDEKTELHMISSDFYVSEPYLKAKSAGKDFALIYLPERVEVCDSSTNLVVVPMDLNLTTFMYFAKESMAGFDETKRYFECFTLGAGLTTNGEVSSKVQLMKLPSMELKVDIFRLPILVSRLGPKQRACFGDSGGPVLCSIGPQYIQVGLSSEIAEEHRKFSNIPLPRKSEVRYCEGANLLLVAPMSRNFPKILELLYARGLAEQFFADQLKCYH